LPEGRRPTVVTLPDLTASTSWYLMASRQANPVIARARLRGTDASGVTLGGIEEATTMDDDGQVRSYPGVAISAQHTIGLSTVSRIGAVKRNKT